MENKEPDFTKGFNSGYLMAQYEPELIGSLTKSRNHNNEFFNGLISGKETYDKEKARISEKDLSQENTKDKGKEDIDRDME